MLTVKSEMTPNAFEMMPSYQFLSLKFLETSPYEHATKVTPGCPVTAGEIMEGWYKLHTFFCLCWARGGRMLKCLSTIQLVEPFAASLVWAVIFTVVLRLIFIGVFLQACFSIGPSTRASFCLCTAFLYICPFWRMTSGVFAQSTSGLEGWDFHQRWQNASQCFVRSALALEAE